MNVPGGGKNDIPNRLKRHFAIFYVPPPSTTAVTTVFHALIQVDSSTRLIQHDAFLLEQSCLLAWSAALCDALL